MCWRDGIHILNDPQRLLVDGRPKVHVVNQLLISYDSWIPEFTNIWRVRQVLEIFTFLKNKECDRSLKRTGT